MIMICLVFINRQMHNSAEKVLLAFHFQPESLQLFSLAIQILTVLTAVGTEHSGSENSV